MLDWKYLGTPKTEERGAWLGERSEECVVQTDNGKRYIARLYSISVGCSKSSNWYTDDGAILDNVVKWIELD